MTAKFFGGDDMAIKKKKPAVVEISDKFFDREEHKYNLKKHLLNLNSSTDGYEILMIYSGVKDIGKSSLLKWFTDNAIKNDFPATKFVRYNFKDGKTDMLTVLKFLRRV